MTEADARALAPGLLTLPDDKAADARFLHTLARWCYRFTPRIALDGHDGLWLDITGCARLFNGEPALKSRLQTNLAAFGLEAKTAIAPTPGAAHALARFSADNPIITAGSLRPALENLPPEALRLAPSVIVSLHQLGLTRISQLHQLPAKALMRRFGEQTYRRLAQAHGHEAESLNFIAIHPPFKVSLTLAEPLHHQKAIEVGTEQLLHQLCEKLTARAKGLRQLTLTLEQSNHHTTTLHIGTATPLADPARIMHLLRLKLDRLEKDTDISPNSGHGIDRMHLHAVHTAPLHHGQIDIAGHTSSHQHNNANDSFTSLMDRLAVQLGAENIQRFTPAESHIPERGFTSHSAQFLPPQPTHQHSQTSWPTAPSRPLYLFLKPIPLGALKSNSFTHQNQRYHIAHHWGPERIEPEWWWDDPAWRSGTRDYWRLATTDGTHFWAFCTSPATPGDAAAWYLHGCFT